MAALSGLLVSLSFPKPQVSVLALVGLAPLLLAVASAGNLRQCLLSGFAWGACFYGMLIYWISEVMIQFGHLDALTAFLIHVLLVAVLALFPTTFALVLWAIHLRMGPWFWLAAPFVWVTLEWLRDLTPLGGFPWGQLGYAMAPHLGFMQLTSLTGIYGATFMVVLCNSILAIRVLNSKEGPRLNYSILSATGLFLAFWLAGYMYLLRARAADEAQSGVTVTILQGNIAFDNDLSEAKKVFDDFYYSATERAFDTGSRVVVWPESPTPYNFQDASYRQKIESLAREGQGALILNDITEEQRAGRHDYFNSALFINDQGSLVARYDKNHLVPYGEYVPLAGVLGFADALTREVGAFSAGQNPVVAHLGRHSVGAFICYEAIFPELVRKFSLLGAHWLVNLTNDAWYGDTAAPYQHLQMAVVRAIENRRYLVRAANSGISAVITPLGEIVGQRGLFERAVLNAVIYPRENLSIYVRFGDLFAVACAIITVFWIVSCLRAMGSRIDPTRQ